MRDISAGYWRIDFRIGFKAFLQKPITAAQALSLFNKFPADLVLQDQFQAFKEIVLPEFMGDPCGSNPWYVCER